MASSSYEKTYRCSNCGQTHTEKIPRGSLSPVNPECSNCGCGVRGQIRYPHYENGHIVWTQDMDAGEMGV